MKVLGIELYADFDIPHLDTLWIIPGDLSVKSLQEEVKMKFNISGDLSYYQKEIPTYEVVEYTEKLLKRYGATKLSVEKLTISRH